MILKLDFDSDRAYRHFRRVRLPWVTRAFARIGIAVKVAKVRRTSRKQGRHAWVAVYPAGPVFDTNLWDATFHAIPIPSEVAFQLLLGSDWMREGLFLRRCLVQDVPTFWRQRRNILYTKKVTR